MRVSSIAVAPVLLLVLHNKISCNGFRHAALSVDYRSRTLPAAATDADADDATTTTARSFGSTNFWADPSRVASLLDPPSPARLAVIRSEPYKGGFEPAADVPEPYAPAILRGSIPKDLVGSLASNGAGRIRIGDMQYGHWFDGDGFVTLLGLDGKTNSASFRARYVRSGRFEAQERLMETLRRENDSETLSRPPLAFSGAWTKRGKGEWYENIGRIPTSPANTATMWVQRSATTDTDNDDDDGLPPRLFALCEGGHPIELDPKTLDVVRNEAPLTSADGSDRVRSFFSAHFQRCPVTGDIYNHGFLIRPGPLPKQINVCKLSADGSLIAQAKSSLPFDCLTHDSGMTSNHLVFFLPPYYIPNYDGLPSLVSGTSTLGDLLEWHGDDDTAYVQIHSRDCLTMRWRIALPDVTSLYHIVDAYEFEEVGDGSTTSGTICLKVRIAQHDPPRSRAIVEQQFSNQYEVAAGERINAVLREFTFRLEKDGEGTLIDTGSVAKDSAPCEFPVVNSAFCPEERRRYCWTNAQSDPSVDWLDGIQKIDMETGTSSKFMVFGPDSFAGPPTFVPKENMDSEDDGYIITTVYRSKEHRSDVIVMDAANLQTLCILGLRQHIPFQFHGDFVSGYVNM